MKRISSLFQQLRREQKKALIPFITAGDPDLKTTERLIFLLEKAGASLIELGVPFSDPMADGPVIQKASERALAKGTTLNKIFSLVKRVRRKSSIPILLMGYYNPILSLGVESFAHKAKEAGVDAALIVDLPPEEAGEFNRALAAQGLAQIFLLAPTSTPDRIKKVARMARGFIYYVSMTGITGAKLNQTGELESQLAEIRRHTKLPLCVGFGISKPSQAKLIRPHADGIVVGSKLVELIYENYRKKNFDVIIVKFIHSLL